MDWEKKYNICLQNIENLSTISECTSLRSVTASGWLEVSLLLLQYNILPRVTAFD